MNWILICVANRTLHRPWRLTRFASSVLSKNNNKPSFGPFFCSPLFPLPFLRSEVLSPKKKQNFVNIPFPPFARNDDLGVNNDLYY